jgi:hypothetical protein
MNVIIVFEVTKLKFKHRVSFFCLLQVQIFTHFLSFTFYFLLTLSNLMGFYLPVLLIIVS